MDRYTHQIKEGRLPVVYGQSHVDGAATGVQVAGALSGIGQAVQKFGAVMKRRQDEWDTTRAMEANNEFVKRMTLYMDDPDEGVTHSRKLSLARGVTDAADKDADRFIAEIEAKLENDAQKEAFRSLAERSKMPFWRQASNHEAGEIKQYRDQVFKTTLDDGLNGVMGDPMDDSRFEAAAVNGALAIRAQFVGADDKTVEAAVKGYVSGLEAARIAAVSEDNPRLADELIKGSPYLTPQDARKLRDSVRPKVELLRRQELVDGFVGKFGPDQEQDGVAYLRANYEGEEEERLVSAYRSRIGEMRVKEVNEDRQRALAQKEAYDALYKEFWAKGENPPNELLDAMLADGRISPEQHRTGVNWNKIAYTRAEITRQLEKSPDWGKLTYEQQQERVMSKMGVSQKEREEALKALQAGVLDGSVSDEIITHAYQSGLITSSEETQLKKLGSQQTEANKAFVAQQSKELQNDMDLIGISSNNNRMYKGLAVSAFSALIAQIDPTSKTYRQEVMDARRAAMVQVIKDSGRPQSGWFGITTSFGDRVDNALRKLEEAASRTEEYRPTFRPSNINLGVAGGGVGSGGGVVNEALNAHSVATKGKRYQTGGKDAKAGGLDCSGLVCSAMGDMMKDTNKRLGYEAFGPEARAAVKGFSADIIENVAKATGFEKVNPVLSDLRPGMIIGLDAGSGAGGRGYKGIDHVGVVIAGKDGKLKIYESNAKQNVVVVDAERYLDRYKGKGVPIYLVNPLLMMKQPANTPAKTPARAPATPVSGPMASGDVPVSGDAKPKLNDILFGGKGGL